MDKLTVFKLVKRINRFPLSKLQTNFREDQNVYGEDFHHNVMKNHELKGCDKIHPFDCEHLSV
jgi:uncharacterized protein YlbG (UPF0298 family)